jgi:hypothetical protein
MKLGQNYFRHLNLWTDTRENKSQNRRMNNHFFVHHISLLLMLDWGKEWRQFDVDWISNSTL